MSHPWEVIAEDLYLARGEAVSDHRPYFQGDVFRDVPLPALPDEPPQSSAEIDFPRRLVMLLPHPCGCHRGDSLRPRLTVAPLEELPGGARSDFTSVDWKTNRLFPLPALGDGPRVAAMLETLQWVPSSWLKSERRIACLSLRGVSLLNARLLKQMTRLDESVENIMASLQHQWADAQLWGVWRETTGGPAGYEAWKKTEVDVPGVGRLRPNDVIPGRVPSLIDVLRGTQENAE